MTVERENRLKVARRRMLRKMAQVIGGRSCDEANSLESWIDYAVRSTRFVESEYEKAGMTDWKHEQRRRK